MNPNIERINTLDDFSGLDLEFNLEITPDAEVEIVVDRKAGSSIQGRGFGNLLMQIKTYVLCSSYESY